MSNQEGRQRRSNLTDPALVEAIKQDVLAELRQPYYSPMSDIPPSNRAFAERIKQEVLQQIQWNRTAARGMGRQYMNNLYGAQPVQGYQSGLQNTQQYGQPGNNNYLTMGMPYPDPALVEAVKREVLAQLPVDQETGDEQTQRTGHSPSPYGQAHGSGYYQDPYLVQSISQSVLRDLQAQPQPMAQ